MKKDYGRDNMSSSGRSIFAVVVIIVIGISVGAGAYILYYFVINPQSSTTTSTVPTTSEPTTNHSTMTYFTTYTDHWTTTSTWTYTDYWTTTTWMYTDTCWSTTYYTTYTDTLPTTPPVNNPCDIAIVFATGGLGDRSFNDGCYAGVLKAATDFGLSVTYVEPTSITEYEGYIRFFASHEGYDNPYKLIITIGFDQADALMAVADDYPDQQFAIVDTYVNETTYPNVASLLFAENEGSALVGAIAGLMTQTDKIGFVGGMDIPLINKFLAGYTYGANYTNEGVNVTYAYTNDWVDTSAGQTLADGMYAEGVDIIFAVADRSGLGVFDSCESTIGYNSTPIWTIGVDSPQMYLGTADPDNPAPPTFCLTSMLKRVDVAVYNMIRDAYFGNFTGGPKTFNLANGGVDYEINEDLLILPSAIINAVEELKVNIISGTIVVPSEIYWSV